jgi:hypothetical protein
MAYNSGPVSSDPIGEERKRRIRLPQLLAFPAGDLARVLGLQQQGMVVTPVHAVPESPPPEARLSPVPARLV